MKIAFLFGVETLEQEYNLRQAIENAVNDTGSRLIYTMKSHDEITFIEGIKA